MESFVNLAVIVVVAAVLVWYDTRFFALYGFAVTVGLIIFFSGRLWTLVKVSHAATNAKILAIAERVGVTDADIDRIVANEKSERPKWYQDFERDVKDLSRGSDMRVK
jgi:hypothetical protein